MILQGPDITIGHCQINVRRPARSTPPWIDASQHKATAERVRRLILTVLEELLAKHVSPDHGDLAAVSCDLTLSVQDLKGAAPMARPALRDKLDATLRSAVTAALAKGQPIAPDAIQPPRPAPTLTPNFEESAETTGNQPLDILQAIFPDGTVSAVARTLPIAALIALIEALLMVTPDPQGPPHPSAASPPDRHIADTLMADQRAYKLLRSKLTSAAEALRTAQKGHKPQTVATPISKEIDHLQQEALDLLARAARAEYAMKWPPQSDRVAPKAPDRQAQEHLSQTDQSLQSKLLRAACNGRFDLDELLPLVALSSLARHGIIDALTHDLGDLTPLALAGVAQKVLPPTAEPLGTAANRSLAVLLGLDTAPEGADFAGSAPAMKAPITRAMIAQALLGNLGPGVTVPLVAAAGDFVLFDPAGLSPVLQGSLSQITPLLKEIERPLFLHPSDTDLSNRFGQTGLSIIAAGPLPRHSHAAGLTGPQGWRGHTVGPATLPLTLRRRLPAEAEIAANAAQIWRDLSDHNRLVATAAETPLTDQFDNLASLLAGFALADLGRAQSRHDPKNWADPNPSLVRDRFEKMSGHLTVTNDRISITLPMGRRFTDLRDAGVLRDVTPPAVWFGRPMVFQGG